MKQKESWGFVKWTYDQDGNLMKEKDINAKKEEKEQEKQLDKTEENVRRLRWSNTHKT